MFHLRLTGALLVLAMSVPAAAQQPARARPALPRPAAVPPASPEQIEAAAIAHLGSYDCEFGEKVSVDTNRRFDGYLDVKHKTRIWIMRPVLSRTGALRLEDVRGRMLMLQIADKSMLMDTQIGQRLVDNCVHERQREATAARKAAGGGESIGIDPARAASAPAMVASAPAAAASAASAP